MGMPANTLTVKHHASILTTTSHFMAISVTAKWQ